MQQYLVLTLTLLFLFFSFPALAKDFCDKNLTPIADKSRAYQQRGDVCVGVYRPDVAGAELELINLTFGQVKYELDKEEILSFSTPFSSQKSHIRGVTTSGKVFFRLDAKYEKQPVEYKAKNLVREKLSANKMGFFAWLDGKKEKIYTPVKVISKLSSHNPSNKILVKLKMQAIGKAEWRFAYTNKDGQCLSFKALKQAKVKNSIISFNLPKTTKHLLCIEVQAYKKNQIKNPRSKNFKVALGTS